MEYGFDIEEATKYGLSCAVFLKNLKFWIIKNKANSKNEYEIEIDGKMQYRTWTYNSVRAYSILFPFWTEKQVRTVIKKLIDNDIIIKGNFNKIGYDKTSWYAFKDESFCLFGQMDNTKKSDRNDNNVIPIPDNNTNKKTDNNTNKIARFKKPTHEEIQQYCTDKNITIDIDNFLDYYESNGWMVGKNKMKSWPHTVNTWSRNNFNNKQPAGKKTLPYKNEAVEKLKRERAEQEQKEIDDKKIYDEKIKKEKAEFIKACQEGRL